MSDRYAHSRHIRHTKNAPCGTMGLDLVVDVMIKANGLTDAEIAACELKAYAAAHRAAADYVKGVLAAKAVGSRLAGRPAPPC